MDQVAEYSGIIIDYSRDSLIPEQGLSMLTSTGFYKKDHERSPQETFARASVCYSFGDYELAQRIYDYASKGWFTNASPVLSNAVDVMWPTFSKTEFEAAGDWLEDEVIPDGLPISCFLSMISDNKQSLVETRSEAEWLSMMGGGVGIYAGNRSPDEKSTGVMAHLRGYDADTLAFRQTSTRRGSTAAYMDVTHPEILSFIEMRNPIGGDQNKKCFNLNNGVNIKDSFMEAVIEGEEYELVDPKHGNTGRKLKAREVWERLMELRFETGEPYLNFIDTVNRGIPEWIRNPLYQVYQSNLCTEITLRTTSKRTAVCCLSSANLDMWDEWKDTPMIADLVRYLDNVLEYFIRLAPSTLKRAIHSAKKERAIGLGTLGWHSFLQSKMIPFESGGFNSAAQYSDIIYSKIKAQAVKESLVLGSERGEAPDTEGSGMRNSHLMAIAPNASSSSLVGASPSIEPWSAVAFNAQGRAGSFLIKNKYFKDVLERYSKNTKSIWDSIIENSGSIQHLDFLTDLERSVFKTSTEIQPKWIVELASIRQKYICQAQSINLFFSSGATAQEVSDIHILAWSRGLKSLYYCRTEAAGKASIGTGRDRPLNAVPVRTSVEFDECLSCEG